MGSDQVQAALKSSRYNDTVVVHVSSPREGDEQENEEEEKGREILLIPCLDEDNGGIIWNDLAAAVTTNDDNTKTTEDKDTDDIGILRHLRTKQWFFPMLNDRKRNELYEQAIRAACHQVVQQKLLQRMEENSATEPENENFNNTPRVIIRVLDIGSGTGLLAMMAAKYMDEALVEILQEQSSNDNDDNTREKVDYQVQVTSLEMSAAMSRLARMTVHDNHLQTQVTVREQHSLEMNAVDTQNNDDNDKFDLCVSELLESSLLGEGIVPALRDAWERHLQPHAVMVPQQARYFAQLVEGPCLAKYWGPHTTHDYTSKNEKDGANLSLHLSNKPGDVMFSGDPAKGGFVLHIHAEAWMDQNTSSNKKADKGDNITPPSATATKHYDKLKPLSDPVQVLHFDFSTPGRLPSAQGRSIATQLVPHTSGTAHGVLFWWELDLWRGATTSSSSIKQNENQNGEQEFTTRMNHETTTHELGADTGNCCTYSTQVGKQPWQDHWLQNLFVFTNSHTSNDDPEISDGGAAQWGHSVVAQESCHLIASHSDTSAWFAVDTTPATTRSEAINDPPNKRIKHDKHVTNSATAISKPPVTPPYNPSISPYRAWQLNDESRRNFLHQGIVAALAHKGKDAIVLDVSDFSLCGMLAALEGASRVSSVESSTGVVPETSARVAQLANKLPLPNNLFQILQCHAEQLSLELLNVEDSSGDKLDPVEIVAAEPYYEMLEGWHLLEALNYFYLVQSLRKRGILSESAISVPSVAVIWGCAIQSFQLKGAYSGCGAESDMQDDSNDKATVGGFDHSRANQYGDRFDRYDLSLSMGEYDVTELTEPFEISRLEYDSTISSPSRGEGAIAKGGVTVRAPFVRDGVCHGMVVWISYGINQRPGDSENASFDFYSRQGRSDRQLFRMLPKPVSVEKADIAKHEIVCHLQIGNQKQLESYAISLDIEKVGADMTC